MAMTPSEKGTASPVGLTASPAPYQIIPITSDTVGSRSSANIDRIPEAIAFCLISLCLGIGIANRYFRLDQDASLAIVSPKKIATIMGSRNVPDTKRANTTKFGALA